MKKKEKKKTDRCTNGFLFYFLLVQLLSGPPSPISKGGSIDTRQPPGFVPVYSLEQTAAAQTSYYHSPFFIKSSSPRLWSAAETPTRNTRKTTFLFLCDTHTQTHTYDKKRRRGGYDRLLSWVLLGPDPVESSRPEERWRNPLECHHDEKRKKNKKETLLLFFLLLLLDGSTIIPVALLELDAIIRI